MSMFRFGAAPGTCPGRAALAAVLCCVPLLLAGGCAPLAQNASAGRTAQRPPRAVENPAEFIVSSTPAWIRYKDRAGVGPDKREQASEQDFRALSGTGLSRVGLPRALSESSFPVAVDGVLGETVLQFECEGACENLLISTRAPDNRGTVVRFDGHLAFPLLRIRNPTMYPLALELNVDRASNGGKPFRIKLTQWRFYLWSR